jgi:succinyl-CoA synthetase alpha subunit
MNKIITVGLLLLTTTAFALPTAQKAKAQTKQIVVSKHQIKYEKALKMVDERINWAISHGLYSVSVYTEGITQEEYENIMNNLRTKGYKVIAHHRPTSIIPLGFSVYWS